MDNEYRMIMLATYLTEETKEMHMLADDILLAACSPSARITDTLRDEYRRYMHIVSNEALQEHFQTCGFQVPGNRCMELEDILKCIIQKEDIDLEPAESRANHETLC